MEGKGGKEGVSMRDGTGKKRNNAWISREAGNSWERLCQYFETDCTVRR